MEKKQYKNFVGTPIRIESSTVENADGAWNSTKISIYNSNSLIGEYLRNYHSYGALTFYPFQIDSTWYALYSASYTATRVMKLHDDRIEDWCGEDNDANGFCPVEMYVPRYNYARHEHIVSGEKREYSTYSVDTGSEQDFLHEQKDVEFVSVHYCDFAFICGCIWGDDHSWKIRYVDLSSVPDKKLLITDKFGYCEMPQELSLRQCINMSVWEPDHSWITITRAETINLKTGDHG